MRIRVFNRQAKLVGPVEAAPVAKSDAEWQAQLSPAQFAVARRKGTERPFCGTLLDNKRNGVYACVCCRLPLFQSGAKFQSGTGWPSFFQPIADENVATHADRGYGMIRTEILCARCGAHLGHVFDDGPAPTHQRHCVNSESLVFVDEADLAQLADPAAENAAK
jgi:methionine-R-sulfoxide reductase